MHSADDPARIEISNLFRWYTDHTYSPKSAASTKVEQMSAKSPDDSIDYQEAIRRILVARETNAEILDLGDLDLEELPVEIGSLSGLRILALGDLQPNGEEGKLDWEYREGEIFSRIKDLSVLVRIPELRELSLSGCTGLTDIAPLAQLANLTSLDLSRCAGVTDVAPLAQLANLTSLDLSWCAGVTDVAPLAQLANLTSLNLYECAGVTDVAPLAQLANLTSLDLSGCAGVTDVAPLAQLANLAWLNLSGCMGVTDVAPLARLSNLTSLDLCGCKRIRTFEPLSRLLLQLDSLYLHGCELSDLPAEVCGEDAGTNVKDQVHDHYADLRLGAKRDPELKVFVLGNGSVGKTQLCRRLQNLPYDSNVKTTHGIQLGYFNEQLAGFPEAIRMNLWDFGGQDIYHGSHSLFLHGHAIFIILWTPSHETGEFQERGLTIRNQPLAYWLDYVRGLAGTDSPVLIVQSQCDESRHRQSPPPLATGDFHFLRSTEFSAQTTLGLEVLQGLLKEAVRDVVERRPPPPIGVGRIAVRDRLRTMLLEIQNPSGKRKKPLPRTLSKAEYIKICERTKKVTNPDSLLDYLHKTGAVFYRAGLFNDQIILDQTWALNAIYTLFDRTHVAPLLHNSGRFNRPVLETLAWQNYTVEEQRLFLSFMESCGICFKITVPRHDDANQEPEYLAPELLPDWSATRRQLLGRLSDHAPDAEVSVQYRFLHEGILRGFLSRIGRRAGDAAIYWKYGCWFYEETTRTQVLFESNRQFDETQPGAGTVTLKAWGPQPRELLEPLLEALLQIPVGQPPAIEKSWDRESLTARIADHISTERMHLETNSEQTKQRGSIESLVVPARPDLPDDGQIEIFISYAWGDDKTDIGRERESAVEQLCAQLDHWGYRYLRDKRDLPPGHLISDFMKQIRHSDHVIVILSDKYFHSPFCMAELHVIYERFHGDKMEFLKRITPLLLSDAQFSGWRDRVKYAKFWRSEYEDMERDFLHLGAEDHHLYQTVKRWHAVIGDMLAFLNDKLTLRNFDATAADGFAVLKQMLPDRSQDRRDGQ